ncbi:hypothetical protein GW17_00011303 [Ensete ventricosum]|nr:hypothetical protein GW17_00011303 [Ensete ventricosum]
MQCLVRQRNGSDEVFRSTEEREPLPPPSRRDAAKTNFEGGEYEKGRREEREGRNETNQQPRGRKRKSSGKQGSLKSMGSNHTAPGVSSERSVLLLRYAFCCLVESSICAATRGGTQPGGFLLLPSFAFRKARVKRRLINVRSERTVPKKTPRCLTYECPTTVGIMWVPNRVHQSATSSQRGGSNG